MLDLWSWHLQSSSVQTVSVPNSRWKKQTSFFRSQHRGM